MDDMGLLIPSVFIECVCFCRPQSVRVDAWRVHLVVFPCFMMQAFDRNHCGDHINWIHIQYVLPLSLSLIKTKFVIRVLAPKRILKILNS